MKLYEKHHLHEKHHFHKHLLVLLWYNFSHITSYSEFKAWFPQCVSNLIHKNTALFSNNGRYICTPIVVLYSTFINWNPQINHSCSLQTFQQEFENMTFRAKYKQRFPLTDRLYYLTWSRVTANQHFFLSQALAF